MAHRVDLLAGAEGAVEGVETLRQLQQSVASRVEACGVVVGRDERFRRPGRDRRLVLQHTDRRDVVGVGRVDQYPYGDEDIPRSVLLLSQRVLTRRVENTTDVVVLVHDHRGHVTLARVGQCQDGRLGEIDDREAVERVAVEPDHRLLVDRGGFPVVPELPPPPPAASWMSANIRCVSARTKLSTLTWPDMRCLPRISTRRPVSDATVGDIEA